MYKSLIGFNFHQLKLPNGMSSHAMDLSCQRKIFLFITVIDVICDLIFVFFEDYLCFAHLAKY